MFDKFRLNPNMLFSEDHLGIDLSKRSVHGGLVSIISQGISFVISIVGTIILARLLTPNDFGLVGMVTAITGFVTMLKNAGLSMATIQSKSISNSQVSSLFFINLFLSFTLGSILIIAAPIIAGFYQQPELIQLTIVISLTFIITGLSIQHHALLYRHMNLVALAIVLITSQLISLIISIFLALLGWGYWALAVSSLVSSIASTMLTYYFCPWLPNRYQKNSGIKKMLEFGGDLTISNLSNYLASNMDNVLIGRYLGADALGIYAKAYQLFLLPIKQIKDPLQNTALPILSALVDQPNRYRNYYQRFMELLASVSIPIAVCCIIEADFIILTFLGQQWHEAIPLFRVFAILALIYPLAGTQGLVMVSLGKSRRFLWWGIITAILSIMSFSIGLRFGIYGVAIAFTIMNYIVLVPSLFFSFRNTPITVLLFFQVISMPLLLSLFAGGFAIATRYILDGNYILNRFLELSLFGLIYLSFSYRRAPLRYIFSLIKKNLPSSLTNAKN